MQYITGTRDFQIQDRTAVTLGKFDGVHRGHQKLLSEVFRFREKGLKAAVFTFSTTPKTLMSGRLQTMITTNEERRKILESFGVDYLVEFPFNRETASMEPEAFVREVLVTRMHAGAIVTGPDFRFGHNRGGDIYLLRKLAPVYGFTAVTVPKLSDGTRDISSTYVREELAAGHIRKANELLGYAYSISGTVVHGRHLGTTLGFPTVNILPPIQKHLPIFGVYLSETLIDGKLYNSLTNIGRKPTIEGEHPVSVETYIYDLDADLYGKFIEVRMIDFFRPEIKFESLSDLQARVNLDKEQGRLEHQDRKKSE
jgi:riboflavin kinase/FMN adenylyltransferase